MTAADANLIFAYVPAWQYGQADFGIFIEQTSFGDILTKFSGCRNRRKISYRTDFNSPQQSIIISPEGGLAV